MKTVLLVEDDPVNAQMMAHFLEAHGYKTLTARTGIEGVEMFEQERPDMAIVDVQLPRKNGFEVCFDMKRSEHGRTTPVLLVSAVYTDKEHAERHSADLKAEGYLVKPFEMQTLLDRVQALIGSA
jgi:DNA-binding response OmpR family regulator